MRKLTRHVTVLMKVSIALACLGMAILWPQWRDVFLALGYGGEGPFECMDDVDCGSGQFCEKIFTEEQGETILQKAVCLSLGGCESDNDCLPDERCELFGPGIPNECVPIPEPPEPPGEPPPPPPPPGEPPPPVEPPPPPSPGEPPPPPPPPPKAADPVDDPCLQAGSIIAAQNQSLGEVVALVGTPFRLHYQSDREPGRTDAHAVAVAHAEPLGGWTVNVHHALDPADPTLFLGDCRRRSAAALGALAQTAAGEFVIAAEDGREVYVFDASGRHLFTRHALTGAVRYQFSYDGAGDLVAITDGAGNVTTVERDPAGVPIAIVAPFGQRTTLTLDASGYLASLTNPAGEVVQLGYATGGLLTSLTDPRGAVSAFSYDAAGQLLREDDPAGAKTLARTETATGYTVSLSTTLGRTTSYAVERPPQGGERWLTTFPNGLQTEWLKDPGDTRTTHLPDGSLMTVTFHPDPRWGLQVPVPQPHTLSFPSGLVMTTIISREAVLADPNNLLSLLSQTDTVSVNGRTYTSLYDAATRTFTDTTPAGRSRTTTLDALGRVITEQTAGLFPVSYDYDALGRLANITQGTGAEARTTSLRYDDAGYLFRVTNPLGQMTLFTYDAAGRVATQLLPDAEVIGYAYDANGNLTTLTPPGRPAHTLAYTPVDQLSAYHPPAEAGSETPTFYTYNADRQLTLITRPDGQNVSFHYDAAGRPAALTWPAGETQYTYDPMTGALTDVTAPEGIRVTYAYDGPLRTGEAWTGPITGSVGFTYDTNLRVTEQRLNGGAPLTFEYDADGLLTRAGELLLLREPQTGLLTGTMLGSLTESLTYNGFGEVTSTTVASGNIPMFAVQYSRDPLGRLAQRTETQGGGTATEAYTYDVVGRLITVVKNGAMLATYTYDSNGNRVSATGPNSIITASYDAQDRLLQYGSTTYTYTAGGELHSRTTNGQTTTYDYDAQGNLRGVTLPDSTQLTYLVDGHYRRLGKQVNGTLVQGWLYDGQVQIVAELDGSGQVISQFVYGDQANVPSYMLKGGVTYRIITDHLGSPRLVIDTVTGMIVQQIDYDTFGNVQQDTNPGFQPFGFAGGLYDQHTKLVRFGARDYDPETGRWTAKDPIFFAGGELNLYVYAANNPVNFIDPSGLLIAGLINAGEAYGEDAAEYWAERSIDPSNAWYETAGYWILGSFASLWTPCTSDKTFATLTAATGVATASRAGWSAWARRYPNAGGGGIGIDRFGKNVIRADWHRFKSKGQIVTRPHIDIPGKVKHWPWN